MALGSERFGIVSLVLFSGLKLAAAGCTIGLTGAFFASRLLKSLVFGVSTLDPLVLRSSPSRSSCWRWPPLPCCRRGAPRRSTPSRYCEGNDTADCPTEFPVTKILTTR